MNGGSLVIYRVFGRDMIVHRRHAEDLIAELGIGEIVPFPIHHHTGEGLDTRNPNFIPDPFGRPPA